MDCQLSMLFLFSCQKNYGAHEGYGKFAKSLLFHSASTSFEGLKATKEKVMLVISSFIVIPKHYDREQRKNNL